MSTSRRPRAVEEDEPELQPVTAQRVRPAVPQAVEQEDEAAPAKPSKKPLYPRLLRLQHIHPNAWQRAALGEGAVGVGVLLAMADLATAWSIVALPVAVAVIVKAHDFLQGLLDHGAKPPPPPPDA